MLRFFSLSKRATHTGTRGRPGRARIFRPRLEALEDRQLLSTFTVVLATDNGGPGGQMVTATTGDLRYCVEQADAAHTATSDSIGFSSALTSQPTTITLNSANGPLVLSDSHSVTIDGAGTISVSGGGQVEVFNITSGNVTMNNLAIINGFAANGGGINNTNGGTLSLTNCLLDHDTTASPGDGGGIFNGAHDTLTLTNCTFSNDSAPGGGGSGGGGLWNIGGPVQLNGCTFYLDSGANGGGVKMNGGPPTSMTNCTFSGCSATYNGGAIFAPRATLSNCTVSGNSANIGGGIFVFHTPTTQINLVNTIVAGNTATSSGPDISGTIASADHNLIGNASGSSGLKNGVNGNIVGGNGHPVINPRLGPLQNNGGPTMTMALLAGSPAIAAADNSMAPATDQRGFTRIDETGETTDIGAFEVQSFDPPLPPKATQPLSPKLSLIPIASTAVGSASWQGLSTVAAGPGALHNSPTEFIARSLVAPLSATTGGHIPTVVSNRPGVALGSSTMRRPMSAASPSHAGLAERAADIDFCPRSAERLFGTK